MLPVNSGGHSAYQDVVLVDSYFMGQRDEYSQNSKQGNRHILCTANRNPFIQYFF